MNEWTGLNSLVIPLSLWVWLLVWNLFGDLLRNHFIQAIKSICPCDPQFWPNVHCIVKEIVRTYLIIYCQSIPSSAILSFSLLANLPPPATSARGDLDGVNCWSEGFSGLWLEESSLVKGLLKLIAPSLSNKEVLHRVRKCFLGNKCWTLNIPQYTLIFIKFMLFTSNIWWRCCC